MTHLTAYAGLPLLAGFLALLQWPERPTRDLHSSVLYKDRDESNATLADCRKLRSSLCATHPMQQAVLLTACKSHNL